MPDSYNASCRRRVMKAATRKPTPSKKKTSGMPVTRASLVVPRKSSGAKCSIVPMYQTVRKVTSNSFLLLLTVPRKMAVDGMNRAPDSSATITTMIDDTAPWDIDLPLSS